MPVLLAPEQAPLLQELLADANTIGLDCKPADSEDEPGSRIRGLGSLLYAGPEEISFLSDARLHAQLQGCQAAAVIMTEKDFREHAAQDRA